MDAQPDNKPLPIQLKRTIQIVPGVHNRIVWTNAVNGDLLGEVAFSVSHPTLAQMLASDLLAWVSEATKSVVPAPANLLDQLNGRHRRM